MEQEKIVVGLDIGTTKIAVIVGQMDQHGKIKVLGKGQAVSDGVKDGTVSNINKTIEAIKLAVQKAENESKIEIKVVNVGIAGKHIRSFFQEGSITRNSKDEEVSLDDVNRLNSDMYRIVTEPGTEIIHVLPQYYTVDSEHGIKDPIGMAGVRLSADFHIVTAQTNAVKNIKKCVERAGLEIENVYLEPIASSLAVLSEEEKKAGVVLVDIGGGTTDVAIFHEGIVRHTAVIPFGGQIVTSDIMQGCSLMDSQAESLKVRFGRALSIEAPENEVVAIKGIRDRANKEISLKNLAAIIEARMEEIIHLISVEVDRSGFKEKLAAGVVLTGGGSMLKDLSQLVEYRLGLDARMGYPNEHLAHSLGDTVKSPAHATGIGLVLLGYRALDDRYAMYNQEGFNRQGGSRRTKKGTNIFSNFFDMTKNLLVDNYQDKKDFK